MCWTTEYFIYALRIRKLNEAKAPTSNTRVQWVTPVHQSLFTVECG